MATNFPRPKDPLEGVLWGLTGLLLLLVIYVGLDLRLNDLRVWEDKKEVYFLDGKALFTTYDGFLFARYAKEYEEGLYHWRQIDPLRFVPDNFLEGKIRYRFPPPLSLLFAKLSALSGRPLENLSLYLVPLLAMFFVVPLVLYLREIGDFWAPALLGAFTGVTSLIYLLRTSVARLDTDCLNLFFPFLALFFLARYLRFPKSRWLVAASATLVLYGWWYRAASPLVIGTLLIFSFLAWWTGLGRGRRLWQDLSLLLLPQFWYLWRAPVQLYSYVSRLLFGAGTTEKLFSAYPNVLRSISELNASPDLKKAALFVLANKYLFVAGLLGFCLFLLWERRALLLSLPLFLTGLLLFKAGNRFGMYLAPFVGMGLGFLLSWGTVRLRGLLPEIFSPLAQRALLLLLTLTVGLLVWFHQRPSQRYIATPKVTAPIARQLAALRELTPQGAWIWTWWDYGYAIAYLGRRAVFIDGGTQTTPKTYYVARSLASPSPTEGRNITAFLTKYGLTGIEERLKAGLKPAELTKAIGEGKLLQEWPKQPVYWLFTGDLLRKFGWIGYFGTWDFETRKGKFGVLMSSKPCQSNGARLRCPPFELDGASGLVFWKGRQLRLQKLVVKNARGVQERKFRQSGPIGELVSTRIGLLLVVVDERTFASNFNQMFILRRYDPTLFELVRDDFPFAVLYRVKWPSSS